MTTAILPTYGRADLAFERGSGAWLYTADGRRYLDFASGVAVTGLGHAHPHLVKALTEQAQKVWHTSNIFRIPGQERLAERLAKATFADTVFFANSGAEAIECGLKMVRKYHDDTGHPERYRIVPNTSGARDAASVDRHAVGRSDWRSRLIRHYRRRVCGHRYAPVATILPACRAWRCRHACRGHQCRPRSQCAWACRGGQIE